MSQAEKIILAISMTSSHVELLQLSREITQVEDSFSEFEYDEIVRQLNASQSRIEKSEPVQLH